MSLKIQNSCYWRQKHAFFDIITDLFHTAHFPKQHFNPRPCYLVVYTCTERILWLDPSSISDSSASHRACWGFQLLFHAPFSMPCNYVGSHRRFGLGGAQQGVSSGINCSSLSITYKNPQIQLEHKTKAKTHTNTLHKSTKEPKPQK